MKNILLKSLMIFVLMTVLNVQFAAWSLYFLKDVPGGIGMAPIGIFLICLIASIVGFITILIFKNVYNSIFRVAFLFEIIYLVTLIISGANPFQYFFTKKEVLLLDLLIYINSFVILFIMYLIHLLYSKTILSKSKN
jgi:hypothetical protein